jgi:hypothetical protein
MRVVQDCLREYVNGVNRGVPPEEMRRSLLQRMEKNLNACEGAADWI